MITLLLCAVLMADAPKAKYNVGDIVTLADKNLEGRLSIIVGPPTGKFDQKTGHEYECLCAGQLTVGLVHENTLDDITEMEMGYYAAYVGKKPWDIIKKEQLEFTRQLLKK